MKIENIRVFEGRNIYSHKKCIRMDVDLEGYSNISSKEIEGFSKTLLNYVPELREHSCCVGRKGGFVERLYEGTYLSHICEHVIIALQNRIGIDVSYGKAREIEGERYYIIYQYKYKNMAIECGKIAVDLINNIINGKRYNIKTKTRELACLLKTEELGPSTLSIIQEAKKRNIPVIKIGEDSMFQLGYGIKGKTIEATICNSTSAVSVDIACDKLLSKNILMDQCIPVAEGYKVKNYIDLLFKAEKLGYPVVLKPRFGNQGKGVVVNIRNQKELVNAYSIINKKFQDIMIEKYINGKDYRACVVDGKVVAVAQRIPPYIIGNGKSTIYELIKELNRDERRGDGHEKPLTKVKIDKDLKNNIYKEGYTLGYILPNEYKLELRHNANLSTGGVAIDCTDLICNETREICERVAKAIGLNICGIDICCSDISKPLKENEGIMEVNAAPGIRMHQYPYKGKSRNVAKAIVGMMFKEYDGNIPIISITGTNGKTTTTRLIAHILSISGKKVGMTTTGGIYINNKCINKGDTTGYYSAKTVLTNKEVDVAVLELARGGLIRSGLPYDLADVGIITNVTEDHLGLGGIDTLEDMAYVKALVGEAVKKDGYVVINADDEASINIINRMKSKIILFTKNKNNPIIPQYLDNKNLVLYLDGDTIYLKKINKNEEIINVNKIPITLGGKLIYNVENAMAAIAALIALGLDVNTIRQGLESFSNEEQNPGRFNMYNVHGTNVILDYGHNIEGYKVVLESIKKINHKRIIGVVGVPGDRTNSSTLKVGNICGENFDYIYIKEDKDKRGRMDGEIADLLKKGVLETGFKNSKLNIILDEEEALKKAIEFSNPGDLVIMFFEEFEPAANIVKDKIKKGKITKRETALA
ncbi:cyanophycin synthetase [Clostridium botulinum]|uniref:Cyanophycin synthetase n=1 Tax=Clostridium botulinum TaxID=1491 RepID=A0A846J301_CLOBO|nr:cyanophycin synthetase [Clostridium botulinum]ACA56204.1 cyanophycin synthase (L-aspartate-adding) [Clostridium botulinum A3 str. Loch Maree]NFH66765.1 cyanophycin synthetase [Clostridium botulinum]NFJ08349.1 cyanophycin synthetase [Clostridium botulinum]NFK16835.1 cyanophycin synthetase [Clostridium botulinum]NFM94159.1 cyanophycin synthetase [Clostridium botulinum]